MFSDYYESMNMDQLFSIHAQCNYQSILTDFQNQLELDLLFAIYHKHFNIVFFHLNNQSNNFIPIDFHQFTICYFILMIITEIVVLIIITKNFLSNPQVLTLNQADLLLLYFSNILLCV